MYCKTQGIKLEYTVPKTSELNGLAERMNRTIMDRVRSMLSHAKLPKSYWAEAMLTVVYLITRSRSKVEGSHLFGRIGNIPLDFRVF